MTKERFVKIIDELEAGENLQNKIASAVRQFNNLVRSDYPEQYGMVISHEFLVIELLEEIMGDAHHDIEFFCTELEFGKKYNPGDVVDEDGTELDFSSAEKLWEYLTNKNSLNVSN